MITWLSVDTNPPEPGRELIVKYPDKLLLTPASKRCSIKKYNATFSQEMVVNCLLDDGFTLWSYTE